MRSWTPQTLYEVKPWIFIVFGGLLGAGCLVWSLWAGVWTVWRGAGCFAGAALVLVGGATLQMRQDYRARSKWRREKRS